jgi:hypothetical protein
LSDTKTRGKIGSTFIVVVVLVIGSVAWWTSSSDDGESSPKNRVNRSPGPHRVTLELEISNDEPAELLATRRDLVGNAGVETIVKQTVITNWAHSEIVPTGRVVEYKISGVVGEDDRKTKRRGRLTCWIFVDRQEAVKREIVFRPGYGVRAAVSCTAQVGVVD